KIVAKTQIEISPENIEPLRETLHPKCKSYRAIIKLAQQLVGQIDTEVVHYRRLLDLCFSIAPYLNKSEKLFKELAKTDYFHDYFQEIIFRDRLEDFKDLNEALNQIFNNYSSKTINKKLKHIQMMVQLKFD
ncbi:MAG: hypothetical protein MHPSP_000333, partial [Paramarteilia canceri]